MKIILQLACLFAVLALPLHASQGAPGDETHAIAGIGAILAPDVKGNGHQHLRNHVTVRQIASGSPASKNGLKVGDQIIEVDGTKLAGMKFSDAVNDHIRGPLGSPVKLLILRNGASLTMVLVRDIVPMPGQSQP